MQNVGDPIFTLHLDFKPNTGAASEIVKLPDEPKLREFDLQYWEKLEARTFPTIAECITIDPYEE